MLPFIIGLLISYVNVVYFGEPLLRTDGTVYLNRHILAVITPYFMVVSFTLVWILFMFPTLQKNTTLPATLILIGPVLVGPASALIASVESAVTFQLLNIMIMIGLISCLVGFWTTAIRNIRQQTPAVAE